jgi:hypothetical protein
MKQRFLLTIFLLIAGTGISIVKAQSMAIKMKDGTEQIIGLSSLGKVTFSNANLLINQNSGATKTYSLSKIRKINFDSIPTGVEEINLNGSSHKLSFYPNPVESLIYFRNISTDNSLIKIYRMDGAKVLQSRVSSDNNSLDVSGLEKGFYILIANNQVSKFIKQ